MHGGIRRQLRFDPCAGLLPCCAHPDARCVDMGLPPTAIVSTGRSAMTERKSQPAVPAAASGDGFIELRGLHKRFGSLTVLSGVNLSLAKGKTTVVSGESGTGKS